MNRKEQIGIMGSMADTELSQTAKDTAAEIGELLAREGVILVYGYEGDFDSLSEIAARSAEKNGGQTMAFMWGSEKKLHEDLSSIIVSTGMMRGGGREYSLTLSCDGIITIGGGTGTLTEVAMAYQAKIPVVAMKNTGGWSEKLAGQYMDSRKRFAILSADTPLEAVQKILGAVRDSRND